jgi:ABC-2 type transport system permease protein
VTARKETAQTWRRQLHGSLVILKKNAYMYYLKPPVLIFGVLFPLFFFLSFRMGRPVSSQGMVPGMVAMALWFTASAVGPMVTPWERRAKTYERLIASPVSLQAILAGDVISGLVFGVCFSVIPILLGLLFTDAAISSVPMLTAGVVLGALAFSSLGVLLAAPPASSPSNIMLLSNLVRLPLLFVSGIFVPIAEMPVWARYVAPVSPLSYASAVIRHSYGTPVFFPAELSLAMLAVFAVVLFLGACRFHRKWRVKGL